MKTFSAKSLVRDLACTVAFCSLSALTAPAQTATSQILPGATAPSSAPAKAIGPAPVNTPQHQILTTALSPTTRQTLQEAMNSYSTK